MDNERDSLVKALRDVASGSRRSKTARLREIFDEVEEAKAKGASNKQIVAALEAHGLFFDVNNFKNARSRILKERAMKTLTNPSSTVSERPVQLGIGANETKSKMAETSKVNTSKVNQSASPNEMDAQKPGIARPEEKKADSIALAQKYTGGGESSFLDGILNKGENKK